MTNTPIPLPTPEVLETSYWRREGDVWHVRMQGTRDFVICGTLMTSQIDHRERRIYSSGYLNDYIKFRDNPQDSYVYNPLDTPNTTLCRECLEWIGLADFRCACEASMMEE